MIQLLFLNNLSGEEVGRLEGHLYELVGESITREYWEEKFAIPYRISKENEKRILKGYHITIEEE